MVLAFIEAVVIVEGVFVVIVKDPEFLFKEAKDLSVIKTLKVDVG